MDKEKFFSDDDWETRSRKKNGNASIRYGMLPI